MTAATLEQKPDTEMALYVGAIATCVLGLLPYVNVFIFPGYAIGAVVVVSYAVSARKLSLTVKEGAKLGFSSAFLGRMMIVVLVDVVRQFFDY